METVQATERVKKKPREAISGRGSMRDLRMTMVAAISRRNKGSGQFVNDEAESQGSELEGTKEDGCYGK